MQRTILLMALAAWDASAQSNGRQPVEGTIALTRFNFRFETVGEFMVQQGTALTPYRVPEGKVLTIQQVTATCTFAYGSRMTFWTIRSSADSLAHHYLPIRPSNADDTTSWVASERVRIPVRAGVRPVATFQRTSGGGVANDACIGSWSGYLEDVAPTRSGSEVPAPGA